MMSKQRLPFHHLLLLALGLILLLWFEAGLGLVYLTFVFCNRISHRLGLMEWLVLGLLVSLGLAVWFVTPWPLATFIIWLPPLFRPQLKRWRFKQVDLILALVSSGALFYLARLNFRPSFLAILIVELVMLSFVSPREES